VEVEKTGKYELYLEWAVSDSEAQEKQAYLKQALKTKKERSAKSVHGLATDREIKNDPFISRNSKIVFKSN
jgi:hypothetical protein